MDMLIFRTEDGYIVEHFGDCAVQVRRLFGTVFLPTPFRTNVRAIAVRDAIQRLNPNCEVCLHPDLLIEEALAEL